MKRTYITILIVLLLPQALKAQVSEQEFQALKAIYNATDGDNWTKRNGWENINTTATKDDVTTDWDGILKIEEGHIRRLQFYKSNLTGSIPPDIGDLIWIERLLLEGNNITGSIPVEITSLENLKYLCLDNNPIGGTFPDIIGNITSLEKLSLYRCQLSGEIPSSWANLVNLNELTLAYDTINSSFPGEIISSMTNLQQLDLSKCGLSGELPDIFNSLPHLYDIDLYGNSLSGELPPSINNLSHLKTLSLARNQFEGELPAFEASVNLESLRLSINSFTGAIPEHYKDLPELETLYCSNNFLSGPLSLELLEALDNFAFNNNYYTFKQAEPLEGILDYSSDRIYPLTIEEVSVDEWEMLELEAGSLSVYAMGGTNNRYTWFKNDEEIYSGNSPVYTIAEAEKSDAGIYRFEVTNTMIEDVVLQSDNLMVTIISANKVPTGINLAPSTVDENYTGLVGSLSAIDPDTLDNHIFSLVTGDGINDRDNSLFSISGNELNLLTEIDYEVTDTLYFRISANDNNGGIYNGNLCISVSNVNEAPSFADMDTSVTIDETAPIGMELFFLEGSDPELEPVSFSITGGNSDSIFTIENDTVKIADNSSLNYDIKNKYNLEISISDGVDSSSMNFIIKLNKITDIPIARDTEFIVTENLPAGSIIGVIEAFDPEEDSLYYSITGGNETEIFSLSADTLIVADSVAFNLQAKYQFILEITISDGTNSTSITVTINHQIITNVLTDARIQYRVFPNPVKNKLYIQNADEETMAYIISTSGKLIQSMPVFQENIEIDLSWLNPGIYILKTTVNQSPQVYKIIKE